MLSGAASKPSSTLSDALSKMARQPRTLVRWGGEYSTSKDSLAANEVVDWEEKMLMLSLQLAANERGITLPWYRVVHHLNNLDIPATEGAIIQHLAKMRQRLVASGEGVPPALRRGGVTNVGSKGSTARSSATKQSATKSNKTDANDYTIEDTNITNTTKSTEINKINKYKKTNKVKSPVSRTSTRVAKTRKKTAPKAKKQSSSPDDDDDDSAATIVDDDPEAEYNPTKNTPPPRGSKRTRETTESIKEEDSDDGDHESDDEYEKPAKQPRLIAQGNELLKLTSSDAGSPPAYNGIEQVENYLSLVWTVNYSTLPKVNAVMKDPGFAPLPARPNDFIVGTDQPIYYDNLGMPTYPHYSLSNLSAPPVNTHGYGTQPGGTACFWDFPGQSNGNSMSYNHAAQNFTSQNSTNTTAPNGQYAAINDTIPAGGAPFGGQNASLSGQQRDLSSSTEQSSAPQFNFADDLLDEQYGLDDPLLGGGLGKSSSRNGNNLSFPERKKESLAKSRSHSRRR